MGFYGFSEPHPIKDSDIVFTDNTSNDVSITKHGFVPKAPNDSTKYLNGVGAYAVPAGGSSPSHAYFTHLAAQLEPLAIEPLQKDTFSYAISGGTVKWILAMWDCRIGSSGRFDTRTIKPFLPLSGVTLVGIDAGATAAILDPSLPTYTDAWKTYYDRLNTLASTTPQFFPLTAASTNYSFLPGPYGSIILNVSGLNFVWVAPGAQGSTSAIPWQYEIGDTGSTDHVRFADAMFFPVSKNIVARMETGQAGGVASPLGTTTPNGSVLYTVLPSSWGTITDPTSYTFRDDFMGATLDTASVWTRANTGGTCEIDTRFQWCKLVGDGTWGHNGAYTQSSIARANGKVFLCDVSVDGTAALTSVFPGLVVGWSDGGGQSYTNFSHGVDFTTVSSRPAIFVFENGNSRGEVGNRYSAGQIYRVRITLGSSNNAKYEIQGGTEYAALGGSTWTDITPGTTSSSTTPLHAGMTEQQAVNCWVGDVKLY